MIRKLAITAMAALVATGLLAATPAGQAKPAAKAKASATSPQAKAHVKHVTHRAKKPVTTESSSAKAAKKTSGRLPVRTHRPTAPKSSPSVHHRGASKKGTTAGSTSSTPPTTPTR